MRHSTENRELAVVACNMVSTRSASLDRAVVACNMVTKTTMQQPMQVKTYLFAAPARRP